MPNLYTVPAGESLAHAAARHALAQWGVAGLANAVIFVPNRRARSVMRQAFHDALDGQAAFLPRVVPLADIATEILTLLGSSALGILTDIPPAMSEAEHRYMLCEQVTAFERRRMEQVGMPYALAMTEALMELQQHCTRHDVTLTQIKLRQLYYEDYAHHWREAILFLGILTDSWPALEKALGRTTQAAREIAVLRSLAAHWHANPANFPVMVVGSTASQPATAQLLKVIADMPTGQVVLPGLDPAMDGPAWHAISPAHPMFHIKRFLEQWPVSPAQVVPLAPAQAPLWLAAMAPTEAMAQWHRHPRLDDQGISIIESAHSEEEARVISLLMREGLEQEGVHTALITPDEGLMARVAAHMQRYGVRVDRLNAGTLATTQTGNLWLTLAKAIAAPARLGVLRALLHHPLLAIDPALLLGLEAGWYGASQRRAGQLPRHSPALHQHPDYAKLSAWVASLAASADDMLTASAWVTRLQQLLGIWGAPTGQADEAVRETLAFLPLADGLGPMPIGDMEALLNERFSAKWRDGGIRTHPRLHMLTPVEARLQHFDRVILASMQDQHWPGADPVSPWLNHAAQAKLGLPSPEERTSLAAHDVLMLASQGEVFLSYALRDAGSPVAPSRFIERLVTLLAAQGADEKALYAPHYVAWANALYASASYTPEAPVRPTPQREERPHTLDVTSIDLLFRDPYSIYARYVLGLTSLNPMDADPEAGDFGSLTHKALERLTRHWNDHARPADEGELAAIAQQALQAWAERPNIDLFWRLRLLAALRFMNLEEQRRRAEGATVLPEEIIASTLKLTTPGGDVLLNLRGRIDRLELRTGGARIVDYKTSKIPSQKALREGRALQLLAYALMLENEGKYIEAIEYIALPKAGEVGKTLPITHDESTAAIMGELKAALARMLDESTPFLARPYDSTADESFTSDYDGVSRYDEWAG